MTSDDYLLVDPGESTQVPCFIPFTPLPARFHGKHILVRAVDDAELDALTNTSDAREINGSQGA